MKGKGKESTLEEKLVYEPSDAVKMKASINRMEDYKQLYQKSIKDPEKFWGELAEQLDWSKKWDKVLEWDFNKPEIKWFVGGSSMRVITVSTGTSTRGGVTRSL